MANFTGTAGNNTLTGTSDADTFDISQGGADTVEGLEGNDIVMVGAAYGSDKINGGAGYDELHLMGDYSAGMTLGGANASLGGVESIVFGAGFSYKITASYVGMNPGSVVKIDGSGLNAGDSLYVDGNGLASARFAMYGGAGNDTFIGSPNSNTFHIGTGGADVVKGGFSFDVINAGAAFDASDKIDGGGGSNRLHLAGDYSAGVTLGSETLRNVYSITFEAGFSYKLTTHDANLRPDAEGAMTIEGREMTAGTSLYIDGSAETNEFFLMYDGASNDTFIGGLQADNFFIGDGGADTVHGGGGGDLVNVVGRFSSDDAIDGGDGEFTDTVALYSDYSAGLTITAAMMTNVERLIVGGANNVYSLTLVDDVVEAGQRLLVEGEVAGTGYLDFDGSAETDGSFSFTDSIGNDILMGGANGDVLAGRRGGSDVFRGNGGDDLFVMYSGKFDSTDRLYGGAGSDSVLLVGDHSAGFAFKPLMINSIEILEVYAGDDYRISINDANVGQGRQLVVDAEALASANHISFNGSAETDGRMLLLGGAGDDVMSSGAMKDKLTGGAGADTLKGGAEADLLTGGIGGDYLYGGAGSDRFLFADVAESSVAASDWIRDWNAGDRIGLSAIDANTGVAGNQAFTFIGSAAFSGAGQLRATTMGSQNTVVSGDIDGDGGADFQIKLLGIQSLSDGSFIL